MSPTPMQGKRHLIGLSPATDLVSITGAHCIGLYGDQEVVGGGRSLDDQSKWQRCWMHDWPALTDQLGIVATPPR